MVYTILGSSAVYYFAEIEAGSFEEAKRIAEDMDSEDFVEETICGEFKIDFIRCEDTEETISLN